MNSAPSRTQNLASCYENALTIIVRLASLQQAANASDFRTSIRAALKAAMEQAKTLGYSGETNQRAFFAVVALLDETVLKLQSPSFAEWARKPLQEEMFGHNRAGNVFFDYLRDLLAQQDSAEAADGLELYCLCLLLGFRGQYALSSGENWSGARSGEIQTLIRQSREKIDRIRGPLRFLPDAQPAPEAPMPVSQDPWSRGLGIAALVMLVFVLLAWGAFWLQLGSTAARIGPA
ncbi:MAG: DotU family type IV/VI secretion system protein [Acidobacteriaceae bacterium]